MRSTNTVVMFLFLGTVIACSPVKKGTNTTTAGMTHLPLYHIHNNK